MGRPGKKRSARAANLEAVDPAAPSAPRVTAGVPSAPSEPSPSKPPPAVKGVGGTKARQPYLRYLAVTADDLGYCSERDAGILRAFDGGALTGASLLVNGETAGEAAAAAVAAGLPLGLHLNLTEGCSLSIAAGAICQPGSGRFLGKPGYWASARDGDMAWSEAVAAEARAQLRLFSELTGGVEPCWVDGHNHAHVAEGAAEALAEVFKEMGVKFVRIPEEWRATCLTHPAEPPSAFLARVAACAGRARKTFAAAGISTTSAFMGLGMMSRFTEEGGGAELGPALQEVYSTLLSMPRPALPGGISLEWMSHPGGACKERAAGRAGCVGGGGADDFAASLCREGEEALLRDRTLLRMLRQDNWHLRPLHEAAAATAITAADGSYGDGRLRVVLLSQLRRATGNATTALRIRSLLVAAGCRVYSLDVDSIDGPGLAAFCEAQGAEAVVGIHAYRAGKTMSSLPFRIRTAIVLGGTDVHRDASDPSKAAAMNVALSRARVVVAFNAPLAEGGGKLLGATDCDKVMQVRQAVRIVPQGQALFDSDGNGGDTEYEKKV